MNKLAISLVYLTLTSAATASPAYIQQSPFTPGVPALTIDMVDIASIESRLSAIIEPISAAELPPATIVQTGLNNSANILQTGRDNLGLVVQQGVHNTASLGQSGARNLGYIHQAGANNSALVRQTGNGHRAIVSQRGTGNVAIIRQY